MDGKACVADGKGASRVGRRRFLAGVGASGLAVAGVVFGAAAPAEALVDAGCCTLCCNPSHDLAQCETGNYYVWSCSGSTVGEAFCECCEHANACSVCNSNNYSSYACSP